MFEQLRICSKADADTIVRLASLNPLSPAWRTTTAHHRVGAKMGKKWFAAQNCDDLWDFDAKIELEDAIDSMHFKDLLRCPLATFQDEGLHL